MTPEEIVQRFQCITRIRVSPHGEVEMAVGPYPSNYGWRKREHFDCPVMKKIFDIASVELTTECKGCNLQVSKEQLKSETK